MVESDTEPITDRTKQAIEGKQNEVIVIKEEEEGENEVEYLIPQSNLNIYDLETGLILKEEQEEQDGEKKTINFNTLDDLCLILKDEIDEYMNQKRKLLKLSPVD